MNDLNTEGPKSWSVYNGADSSPSQAASDREAPWKSFGTSMNAISFGFVATAILISMFLIMAIFEHLLRPRANFSSHQRSPEDLMESGPIRAQIHLLEKLGNSPTMAASYACDFSVMMPGQRYPTFIAQPAPLPCPREGIYWPSHDHGFTSTVS